MGIKDIPRVQSLDGKTRFSQGADQAHIINDGANDRVLIGKRPDGTYGIDVSQVGHDVKTATALQLVMSSKFDTFKIVASATQNVVVPASANTGAYGTHVTLPHGLTTTPVVLGFVNQPRDDELIGTYWFPTPVGDVTGGNNQKSIAVDGTNIYFIVIVGDQNLEAGTYAFKYYVLAETAA